MRTMRTSSREPPGRGAGRVLGAARVSRMALWLRVLRRGGGLMTFYCSCGARFDAHNMDAEIAKLRAWHLAAGHYELFE